MNHLYLPGKSADAPLFVLFHGTGGDENDLVPLAKKLSSDCSILSIRGNVQEHGMNRYFRRHSMGVFDLDDMAFRTKEIYDFLQMISVFHRFDIKNAIGIGYSNGANLLSSLLFTYGPMMKAAIVHHGMVPRKDLPPHNFHSFPILILAGRNDPLVSIQETLDLESMYKNQNGQPTVKWFDSGHRLIMDEINEAKRWLGKI